MTFLKVILIIIASFYLLGIIGRFMLKRFLKKMQQNMMNQQGWNHQNQTDSQQEGEVTVMHNKNKSTKKSFANEDFVEYEEVK
jgi:putative Mn2+ efflux pump MntP